MTHCPSDIVFFPERSKNRVSRASDVLGASIVKKLLAYALFLMGARREDIARRLAIPLGTLFSLLTRVSQHGLPAIEDRRCAASQFLPMPPRTTPRVSVSSDKEKIVVDFGVDGLSVEIPAGNLLQAKTFLLSLLHNGLLSRSDVASILGYSPDHTTRLAQQLADGDVHALLDRRQGQQMDYRVTAEVKAELIQQFAANVVVRKQSSSNMIAAQLRDRCNISLPARTVRHHLGKMGLSRIKHSLPQLVDAFKKNCTNCC